MPTLLEVLSADDLLRLEPEELGGVLLELFAANPDGLHTLATVLNEPFDLNTSVTYPRAQLREIKNAIIEAWCWLEHEGLLVPDAEQGGGSSWRRLSRRGRTLQTATHFAEYMKARSFRLELIHSSIREKVWSTFLRGDHDTAVFQAFKEVEVAVRTAAGLADNQIGVALMDEAFKPRVGPLTDRARSEAEQLAERRLFAGAIGSYKNPRSHRHVGPLSADEAAEMIILASHMLRIVEARAGAAQT